jgi:hypothetical protein
MTAGPARAGRLPGPIIETVVTTRDHEGRVNFAAMGVVWAPDHLVIRPYLRTRTYRNLAATRCAVVNVTDDVLVFVKSALSRETFAWDQARSVPGAVLRDACHWSEVVVQAGVDGPPGGEGRAEVPVRVVGRGFGRPFLGLCRAQHAVVEASIVASRLGWLPADEVDRDLIRLQTLVDRTGGEREREAMGYVLARVQAVRARAAG